MWITPRTHRIRPGGPTSTTYCYYKNGPAGATTFAYDTAGNRTTPSAAYDSLERMTTLSGTGLGYLSPGNGELVSYGTRAFESNMLGLSREIPASGSTNAMIHQPNGALIAQRVGTTSKQWIFTDQLGSTIAISDSTANALARNYTYTPDGDPETTGSGATTDVQYAGGQRIGYLYHYGARYYDPITATWSQQDPINQIGSLGQVNRYAYAGGDPIDLVDPLGTATAGGHCIEGRPGFMPAQCTRAGLKIVTAAEYAKAKGTHVNDCAASVIGLVSSVVGGVASSPTAAGAGAGATGALASLVGIAHSC